MTVRCLISTARPLGLPLLCQLWLRHPVVAREGFAPGPLGRRPDLGAPVRVARSDLVAREHAETPERQAGRERRRGEAVSGVLVAALRRQLRAPHLEVAKVRSALGSVPDEHELDLGEDEAVAAPVLTHHVVQVCQPPEVLDALDVALDAHARVEPVKALNEAHHATRRLAAEDGRRRRRLATDVGHKGALGRRRARHAALAWHRQLQRPVARQGQRSVELGQVEARVGRAGTGMESRAAAPGRAKTLEALKPVHGRTCRTSHQKCFVCGSLRGKEMVRTRAGAGFALVRYETSVRVGPGAGAETSGVKAADASGEDSRGAYACCGWWW
ncbi:hypothetical protein RB595_009804 [Gaeumannomyces hyphopodioides]